MKRKSLARQYVNMRHVGIISMLSVFNAALLVAVTYMTKLVIEAVESDSGAVLTNVLIAVAMLVLYAVTLCLTNYLTTKVSMASTKTMVTKMHSHLLHCPYADITKGHSMERLKVVAGDSELAVSIYIGLFPEIASMALKLIAGIVLMLIIDYKITLIAIAIGLLVCLITLCARKPIKALHKKSQSAIGVANAYMQETMKNAEVVKLLDMGDYVSASVGARLEDVRHTVEARSRLVNIINAIIYLLLEVAFLFVLVYGGVLIARQEMDIAEFVALVGIIEVVKAPFMKTTGIGNSIFTMLASEERVRAICDISEDRYVDEEFDGIVLSHISYSYDNESVIEDLSCSISRGDVLALSGYSGAGKSTLIRLILGIIKPDKGEIYLTRGEEHIPLDGRIIRAGYLPQGLGLWHDTIRANITYGRDVSDEIIYDMLRTVGVYDDIRERGLDYVLGEAGDGLSEGQKQRIAIARALLTPSDIVVLDEPFSALDRAKGEEVFARIKDMHKTLIIASHDDFVIEGAEHVISMGERL